MSPNGDAATHALQDALDWADERHFRPAGRLDHTIQVAGVNVFPDKVRRALMEHPEVQDEAVRRMHADEMSRLKAFIVPRRPAADHASLHAELEAWVAQRLGAPERPRAFTFGASIPVDGSGKRADWPLVTE